MTHARWLILPTVLLVIAIAGGCSRGAASRPSGDEAPSMRSRPTPTVADAEAPNDRDLGYGAGDERLGMRFRPRDFDNGQPASPPSACAPSTIALDVDTASYVRMRGHLARNTKPPADSVRIEEMVNYFPYAYPTPATDTEALRLSATMARCPWAPASRLVRIAVTARGLSDATRPALNLVLAVDTSTSMDRRDRLPLVQHGLALLIARLDARDRVTLVAFGSGARVALPATPGNEQRTIERAIRALQADGDGSNLAAGIRAAYDEAARHARPDVHSRVILCTDGDVSAGAADREAIQKLAIAQRLTGVFLGVCGVGVDTAGDRRLEVLANTANGTYAVVDDELEARKAMADGAFGNLVTVAKDAKLQVFFDPRAVASWRLLGYEDRQLARSGFSDDGIDAGEVGAGHQVTALYEVVPVAGDESNPFAAAGERSAAASPVPGTLLRARLRWQPTAGGASMLIERDLGSVPQAMDDDFRFASAVACAGLLLKRSPARGDCTWDLAHALAVAGRGADSDGLRGEFIALVDRERKR